MQEGSGQFIISCDAKVMLPNVFSIKPKMHHVSSLREQSMKIESAYFTFVRLCFNHTQREKTSKINGSHSTLFVYHNN